MTATDPGYHLEEARRQAREGLRELLGRFGFGQAGSVLDVGCGLGQTLWLLEGPATFKVGVDLDASALSAGAVASAERGDPVVFVRAAAESLPFAAGRFTHVVCRVTLNYVRPDRALAELARVLRSDGLLYCRVEHAGFDLQLLRNAASLREWVSRLNDLLHGIVYNASGRYVRWNPLIRPGRVFHSRWRVERSLRELGLSPLYRQAVGGGRFLPGAFELVARKRAASGGAEPQS